MKNKEWAKKLEKYRKGLKLFYMRNSKVLSKTQLNVLIKLIDEIYREEVKYRDYR